jgi:hypothetical protein
MRSNLETRLRRLERRAGQGDSSFLVVEKLGDEKAFESFRRGLVKTVIVTGVPRGDRRNDYFGKERAREDSK